MRPLLGLLARRYAAWTTAWLFIVGTLVVVTLPAYASTYPDDGARRVAVELRGARGRCSAGRSAPSSRCSWRCWGC